MNISDFILNWILNWIMFGPDSMFKWIIIRYRNSARGEVSEGGFSTYFWESFIYSLGYSTLFTGFHSRFEKHIILNNFFRFFWIKLFTWIFLTKWWMNILLKEYFRFSFELNIEMDHFWPHSTFEWIIKTYRPEFSRKGGTGVPHDGDHFLSTAEHQCRVCETASIDNAKTLPACIDAACRRAPNLGSAVSSCRWRTFGQVQGGIWRTFRLMEVLQFAKFRQVKEGIAEL